MKIAASEVVCRQCVGLHIRAPRSPRICQWMPSAHRCSPGMSDAETTVAKSLWLSTSLADCHHKMQSVRRFPRSAAPFSSQICTGLLRVYDRNSTAVENASGLPCCGRAVHGLVGPVKVPHGPRTRITGRIVLRRPRGEIREFRRRNRSLTGSPD